MTKRFLFPKFFTTLAVIAALLCASACSQATGVNPGTDTPQADKPIISSSTDLPVTSSDSPIISEEADGPTLPADGSEYKYTLLLEGEETSVTCKYVVSDIGFAVAYDPEFFEYSKGEDELGKYLTVYSIYDDIDGIVNYTSFRVVPAALNTAAQDIYTTATGQYAQVVADDVTISERYTNHYSCSGSIDSAEALAEIYVVSLTDSTSLVVELHYTLESAEGFGARMTAMLDSIVLQ